MDVPWESHYFFSHFSDWNHLSKNRMFSNYQKENILSYSFDIDILPLLKQIYFLHVDFRNDILCFPSNIVLKIYFNRRLPACWYAVRLVSCVGLVLVIKWWQVKKFQISSFIHNFSNRNCQYFLQQKYWNYFSYFWYDRSFGGKFLS